MVSTTDELTESDIAELKKLQSEYNSRQQVLTDEDIEFVKTKLASKVWRMNNLYKIRDKDSNLMTLNFNNAQEKVFLKFRHHRKIVLKIRQTGISTGYLAHNLDSCLFTDGYQAGIQSYGLDESTKLSLRAELMWAKLSDNIKELMGLRVITNNSKGITFSNGSVLKIGNFRGDTLQSCHVSELAKIDRISPEKSKELKTGAFQAVGRKNKITIESTAEGKRGLFSEIWHKAEAKVIQLGGKLSKFGGQDPDVPVDYGPFDFQPIFISWVIDEDCVIDTPEVISDELAKYFDSLGSLDIKLKKEQKWWYAAKLNELGSDMKREYPTTSAEAFEQSIEGAYYKDQFENLKIREDLYDENLKVFSSVDLGVNDTFAIGFFQIHPDGAVKIIGEYSNRHKDLEYYWGVYQYLAETKGWVIGNVYVPHDISVFEMTSGKTRMETMLELGFEPLLVSKHKLLDGIEATRQFLKEVEIDKDCIMVIEAIQNYRKKYDRTLKVFLSTPLHDEYSNTADMLRYMAMGLRYNPISSYDIYVRAIRQYNSRERKGLGYQV